MSGVETVGTPAMLIEWSISPCKGDVTYYPTAPTVDRSGTNYFCGKQGSVYGVMRWSTTVKQSSCQIVAGEQWYLNLRVISGCSSTCPMLWGWQKTQ